MSRRECGVGDMTLLEEPARSKEVLKREEEGGKLLRTVSDVGTLFGRFDIDISHDLYAHTRTHRHTQTLVIMCLHTSYTLPSLSYRVFYPDILDRLGQLEGVSHRAAQADLEGIDMDEACKHSRQALQFRCGRDRTSPTFLNPNPVENWRE
jgi:hypothetical protein